MGTSLTALQSGQINGQWCVLIEGVQHAITDGPTAAMVTALSATEWSSVVGGLQLEPSFRQKLVPWEPIVDTGTISFGVMPDESDTIGILAFGSAAGTETFVNEAVDCTETSIDLLSASAFSNSGTVHIGCENVPYTGKSTNTLTGCVRGKYAPFKANTETQQRFGRRHEQPGIGNGYVIPNRASTTQRDWTGRWVRINWHRRVGSTLDTFAQSQCIFAGKITKVRDSANGMTWFDVEPITKVVGRAMVLRDQFTCRVREGIYLKHGWTFRARELISGTQNIATLEVSASPSGSSEIQDGYYTLDEFADALNTWFSAMKVAGTLDLYWTFTPLVNTDEGFRSQFSISGAADGNRAMFECFVNVVEAIGFVGSGFINNAWNVLDADTNDIVGTEVPYRIFAPSAVGSEIEIENIKGTAFDNRAIAPPNFGFGPATGTEVMAIQIMSGGPVITVQYPGLTGDTLTVLAVDNNNLQALSGGTQADPSQWTRVRYDQGGSVIIKQVAVLGDSTAGLLTQMLASTGTAGYNHATYDAYPAQLGCAIPWEALGSGWTESVASVTQADADAFVYIDKPTKFIDVFEGDLVSRMRAFVWKNQSLRLTTWSIPVSATATHAFTEHNKAMAVDATDAMRTPTDDDDSYLVNIIKLEYNRQADGGYLDSYEIKDASSINAHGPRPVTIELRNVYAGLSNSEAAIEEIAGQLSSTMRIFSRPMKVLRRPISPEFYEAVAPGDVASISDNFARNPATGARGLSARACLVIGHDCSYGGYEIDNGDVAAPHGTVDLMLWPRDRIVAYSPTAQIDDSAPNGGYDDGNLTLTCYEHEHSESSQVVDASHFQASGTEIRIIEIDPDDPANPITWTRTCDASSGNTVMLDSSLSSPAWDATKRYRIVSANYSVALTSQQANAYQADDADNKVQDLINAYEYGSDVTGTATWTADDGDELAALYAELQYGDGKPLCTGGERDAARLHNNLVSYRTTIISPHLYRDVLAANSVNGGTHVRAILAIEPITLHPGILNGAYRELLLRAWLRSSTGASTSIRVTLSKYPPYGTQWYISDADAPEYSFDFGPHQTVTFSVSSSTWAVSGVDEVNIADLVSDDRGEGYLTIEGAPNAECRGLAMCWLYKVVPP